MSVGLRLDCIRSSTRHLATGRQRSMFEFDAYGSPVLHGCTGHSGREDFCLGCVSDETPAAPAPSIAERIDGPHDNRWDDHRLHEPCLAPGPAASRVRPRCTRSFRAFGTGSPVGFSEDVQQDGPVHHSVQQCHGQRSVAEVLAPGFELDVCPQCC